MNIHSLQIKTNLSFRMKHQHPQEVQEEEAEHGQNPSQMSL